MEKNVKQIERNVSASFGYVKKDMLMLNDAFSDMHDKIQQLSLDYAKILEEIKKLKNEMSKESKNSEIQNLSMNHMVLLGDVEKLRKEVRKLSDEKKTVAKKRVVKKK